MRNDIIMFGGKRFFFSDKHSYPRESPVPIYTYDPHRGGDGGGGQPLNTLTYNEQRCCCCYYY